jgi:aspartate/methionine/tyrosine aminotransferase
VIDQLTKVLDCLQICAPRPTQVALSWAIEGLADWRRRNRLDIHHRGEVFQRVMADVPGWQVGVLGAYFAYLRHPCPGQSARSVAERLAVERGVLGLPGSAFGPDQEDYLRVSFPNIGPEVLADLPTRLAGWGEAS